MKVGIMTLYYKNYNFGGLLQAYALQQVLNREGFDCQQISYDFKNELKIKFQQESVTDKFRRKLREEGVKGIFKAAANKLHLIRKPYVMYERKAAFERFQEQMIPHTEKVFSALNIEDVVEEFDAFVCGSDQVWNLNMQRSPAFFLNFVPAEKRKISYAASISMNRLEEHDRAFFQKYVPHLDAVSVRSEHERQLLKEAVPGIAVEVVLDPTMLLSQEEWNKLCTPPTIIHEDYILCYFLGERLEHRRFAQSIAKQMNLPIVTFPYIHGYERRADKGFGDLFSVADGPEGFVSLIKHARLIITDSFHGCIFSILYQKDFLALLRTSNRNKKSMNSRIYDLLQRFGLEERLLENLEFGESVLSKPVNYKKAEKVLEKERIRSLEYLRGALGIKKLVRGLRDG